jgi:hypothetical protein
MGRIFDEIDDKLASWIDAQPVFFVGTAPTSTDAHLNISPKGSKETFRLLGPHRCAYLDLVGSGAETIAHLRENGRIVIMFCAFDGPPKVVRLHGAGRNVFPGDPEFDELVAGFNPRPETLTLLRSVTVVDVTRIADSCGFVVPKMALVEERTQLEAWGENKQRTEGDGWKEKYIAVNNRQSIDGLAAIDVPDGDLTLTEAEAARASSAGKAL